MKPNLPTDPRRRAAAPAPGALALAAAACLLALAAARGAGAQSVPADALLHDFEPTGDYLLELDGQVQKAEILRADRVPAFLILCSKLPEPILLLPRDGSLETVSIMKLARRSDGTIDILADAELTPVGRFTIDAGGENILFTVGAAKAALMPKPYLLGLQDIQSLLDYSAEYQRTAAGYQPDAQTMTALRNGAKPTRVRVYFGSWCPHCKRYLPYMLKVAEELKGSKVQVEFYGLPKPFTGEPQAEADDIGGVPTAVVWVGGREVGRIEGDAWRTPETALGRILNGRVGG